MDRNSFLYKMRRKCQQIAFYILPSDLLSKIYCIIVIHKNINLKNPKTLNEKLQWYKLNYCHKNNLIIQCADKFQVRSYIEEKGYRNLLTNLIGYWENVEDIDWNKLPEKFVLKFTHGCAYNILCKDKSTFNIDETKKILKKWLKEDFSTFNVELHLCKYYINEGKMRILHVVSSISIRSGVMSMLMNYYRNIDRDKIQFDFLYFDEREETYEEEINSLGGRVIKIENPMKYFKYRKSINIFFKKNYGKYQIIHIHEIFMSGFLAQCKKIGGIKKIIVHAHATKFSDSRIKNLRNRLLSIPNKFIPDYYFACSKEAGIYCFGKKFKKNGIIIKNAIDLKKFYPCEQDRVIVRKELEIDNKFVIGHIGNFNPQKNHKFLIKIFRKILKEKENSVLVLVGDGNLRKEIEKDVKKYNLEKFVLFLGVRKDVNKIMRTFDCFLFPSLYEGLGIVLVEAQATGVPCIFSDVVPADVNILNKNNEIISLKAQETIWVKKILSLCNKNYKNTYEIITNAGYNIESEAKKMEEVYYSL